MPLKKWKDNIWRNISELVADNKKKGKEMWMNWKKRPMKQMIAIALNMAELDKLKKKEWGKMDKKMDKKMGGEMKEKKSK